MTEANDASRVGDVPSGVDSEPMDLACVGVDLSHRLTSIGILVFFAALILLLGNRGVLGEEMRGACRKQTAGLVLLVTFIACDSSLMLTSLAAWAKGKITGEIAGLLGANAVLMLAALVLYSMAKAGSLDSILDNLARKMTG